MNKVDNGGPAYPHTLIWTELAKDNSLDEYRIPLQGMSLRDYFAGQSLLPWFIPRDQTIQLNYEQLAIHAYKIADAMLAQRSKNGGE